MPHNPTGPGGASRRALWDCRRGPGYSTQGLGYGGAKEDRTPDLLRARQALSQLSYGPGNPAASAATAMVGLGGLEPPTSPLSGVRSNHLSYRPHASSPGRTAAAPDGTGRPRQCAWAPTRRPRPRKEVIQPQVPLGLPCYDFTPVMDHSVAIAPPKVRPTASGATHSHGVTGGVYKARERIHRGILIRDY